MMRTPHLLLAAALVLTPLPALGAGLIMALSASANPVPVNTDVTFTVKGTSGGCPEVILDYGDGQTFTMLNVSFNNNTNTTSPPHKYAAVKTYLVKADPGRGCAGSASVSLNVTSGGGGGAGGGAAGVAGTLGRLSREQAPSTIMASRTPRITSVFPFSVIKPGGGVIVQGERFGPSPGHFRLKLSNGPVTELGNLTWSDTSVSGNIDPNLSGVFDQPATLQIVNGFEMDGNEMPVTYTAAREVRMLPITDVQCSAEPKTDNDKCNDFGPEFNVSFNGFHQCRDVADHVTGCWDSGVDAYWSTLGNGWKLHSVEHYQGKSYSGPPNVVEEGPGPIKITVWWDTRANMSVNYTGRIYIEGPVGTSWK